MRKKSILTSNACLMKQKLALLVKGSALNTAFEIVLREAHYAGRCCNGYNAIDQSANLLKFRIRKSFQRNSIRGGRVSSRAANEDNPSPSLLIQCDGR